MLRELVAMCVIAVIADEEYLTPQAAQSALIVCRRPDQLRDRAQLRVELVASGIGKFGRYAGSDAVGVRCSDGCVDYAGGPDRMIHRRRERAFERVGLAAGG